MLVVVEIVGGFADHGAILDIAERSIGSVTSAGFHAATAGAPT